MSNDKYYDEVLHYLTENGETGVNVLANALNVPLSTMQRYLEKQTYFKKTINRKWDLPSNVETDIKSNTMTLMVSSVENALMVVDSQMAEIQLSIQNALMPVNTLKRAVSALNAPVADKATNMHPSIIKVNEFANVMQKAIKQYMSNVPEEYQELLKNLDIIGMCVNMGLNYINSSENADLTGILLGETDKLTEDTLKVLENHQKEK